MIVRRKKLEARLSELSVKLGQLDAREMVLKKELESIFFKKTNLEQELTKIAKRLGINELIKIERKKVK